jgi:tRNA pseudouridine32 synthase/23S rRNA pseudouridine746 synthase
MTSEGLEHRLLYRDALMLVIDKPAGVPVHAGPRNAQERRAGGPPPLTEMLDALRFGLPRRPELAHRLDRDTSGCLALGRNRAGLERLGRLFKEGRAGKTYWAVVAGSPAEEAGEIDLPLGRRDPERGWWMKVDARGQEAVTRWRVIGRGTAAGAAIAAMALEPLTGRTHQLRVHMAAMGWPILGDAIYGGAPRQGGPMLHLHARALALPLYPGRPAIAVTAPVPPHMAQGLAACGITST